MNKIVHKHYPVTKLPADLQAELDPAGTVTILIESEKDVAPLRPRAALLDEMALIRAGLPQDQTSSAEDVRRLRDEWED